ncbi:MAG TPA: helix-turn-helix transcriptional regulator [Thermomicrobiales bacterium]|nr:helix-turn-helix transcriptional regulator [Thermomicrobiales bacterium]
MTQMTHRPVGEQLRDWRQHRRLSQLDLALSADVSTRHLSFVETGRSQPSREMLVRLAEHLEVPLRERNTLLVAAGYAPIYAATPLDDPAMRVVREAVDLVLAGHEPYPALAIDRHWNIVAANRAVGPLLEGVAPELLAPPVNVLRLSLHPDGLAPRTANLAFWRSHILTRLAHQVESSHDLVLADLHKELSDYPAPDDAGHRLEDARYGDLVVPIRLRTPNGLLSFFTTTTVFGTAVDITLDELAIESFFPADAATAEALRDA